MWVNYPTMGCRMTSWVDQPAEFWSGSLRALCLLDAFSPIKTNNSLLYPYFSYGRTSLSRYYIRIRFHRRGRPASDRSLNWYDPIANDQNESFPNDWYATRVTKADVAAVLPILSMWGTKKVKVSVESLFHDDWMLKFGATISKESPSSFSQRSLAGPTIAWIQNIFWTFGWEDLQWNGTHATFAI